MPLKSIKGCDINNFKLEKILQAVLAYRVVGFSYSYCCPAQALLYPKRWPLFRGMVKWPPTRPGDGVSSIAILSRS